ncbi:MAG: ribose 5-phosphate isomerase B [Halanaerobiaceae bacterium]
MKIAIGSDHAGYDLKKEIIDYLEEAGYKYKDMGTDNSQSVDYPDYGYKVANAVSGGEYDKGILICGTGIGMSIAANKVDGIRAALCHDVFSARLTRKHNNSNVLAMGARVIGNGLALEIAKTWIGEDFDGGRHQRRIDKITDIERGDNNGHE